MAKIAILLLGLQTFGCFVNGSLLPECQPAQPPEWGNLVERILEDGTRQTVFSCDEGRRLKGHKIATCIFDQWDVPTPECVLYELCEAEIVRTCRPHSIRVLCGRWCEPSCDFPGHRLCGIQTKYCEYDCRCVDGYVRNTKTGECIRYDNCVHM